MNKYAPARRLASTSHRNRLKERGIYQKNYFINKEIQALLEQKAAELGVNKTEILMHLDLN